jgi:hypothetical protein
MNGTPVSIGEPDKVTSWPFKEPEKKSAWADAPRDASVRLGDYELDAAEMRTARIKERMSPPGALRLPPKLEAQRLKHGIPDGFFKTQALFDRIFVFPLDLMDGDTKVAPGSAIHRPALTKLKDMQEGNRGVLLSAGLAAADRLMSYGVELGDVVTTNKNVPFARRCERLSDGTDMFYLVMREADLAGDETLATDIREGTKRIVDAGDAGTYEHQVAVNDNGDWDVRKKQSVYIADTW